jgi:mannose-6-phosphate isomerase-like protein (cupin superfamily)
MSSRTIENALPSEPSAGVAEAIANVIRFRDIQPNWPSGSANAGWNIPIYKYSDKPASEFARGVRAAVECSDVRLTTGVAGPGEGAPLHNHTHEELMFVASGSWIVYFDEEERNKVHLEPWDAIIVPANVPRGWRNAGREIGCFLNISSVQDEMTTSGSSCESS